MMHKTLKTFIAMGAIAALAFTAMASAGGGKGPHDKATGSVTWAPSEGPNKGTAIESSFDAHAGAPGAQPDRGTIVTTNTLTGITRTITLNCVLIEGNQAWLGGTNDLGDPVVAYVKDDAQPGGTFNQWTNSPYGKNCEAKWTAGSEFIDGNVKVHSSDTE